MRLRLALHSCWLTLLPPCSLKPDNILLDEPLLAGSLLRPDVVKLGDLGLAMHLDASTGCSTWKPSDNYGTLGYMAPEMLTSSPITAATDTYALGAVLYEMLCGVAPHSGLTNEQLSIALRVCLDPLHPAAAL